MGAVGSGAGVGQRRAVGPCGQRGRAVRCNQNKYSTDLKKRHGLKPTVQCGRRREGSEGLGVMGQSSPWLGQQDDPSSRGARTGIHSVCTE